MNILEQGLLRYLKPEQLSLIQSKKIGIGGAGGLGSNCAMILVRTGFKHLEIIDQDVIDASNLNRQQYFLNEIGLNKVDVTKKRLLDINPDAQDRPEAKRWKDIWSAGHSVSGVSDVPSVAELVDRTEAEYRCSRPSPA